MKKIAFYAGASIPIHAHSLDERPLGGTETGVIRIAEVLAQRGHEVTVFTSHHSPPISNPRYLHHSQVGQCGPFDLLILVQEWRGLFFDLPARQIWVWTGDGPEQYSNYGIGDRRVRERLEKLLVASNYQRAALCAASGFPEEKTFVLGNGVHLPFFEGAESRNKQRLIFTSAPYRGLALVPPLLRELQRTHPEIEFHAFSGMNLYDRERPFEGPHVAQYKAIARVLEKIPGVVLHGNVAQRQLAREYMKSGIFFYPCSVPETFCITALEAQAAGCPIVTSTLGALPETVGSAGVCVPGAVGSERFMSQFVEATKSLLNDPGRYESFAAAGRARALGQGSWESVASKLEQLW